MSILEHVIKSYIHAKLRLTKDCYIEFYRGQVRVLPMRVPNAIPHSGRMPRSNLSGLSQSGALYWLTSLFLLNQRKFI
jgi:hypothetical protein